MKKKKKEKKNSAAQRWKRMSEAVKGEIFMIIIMFA